MIYFARTFKEMKIAVAGEEQRINEFRKIISAKHELIISEKFDSQTDYSSFELIADLNADDRDELATEIFSSEKFVLLCAVKKSLSQLAKGKDISSSVAGINALPTFLSKTTQEISVRNEPEIESWKNIFELLNWEPKFVKDSVGMVSPRILFMIINEACYTLEEGTASKEDIDSGMKLGTAYPTGPLEWADKIGIKNVYETLLAIQHSTNDSRYKICPLLKTMFINQLKFYSAE